MDKLTYWTTGWCGLVLGLACLFGQAGCGRTNAAPAPREAPRVTVGRVEVRSLVDESEYNGWLVAYRTVEVRSRVRGHIRKVHFEGGEVVQPGQLLFELDAAPFEAEVKLAQAEVKAVAAQREAAVKDVARYTQLLQSGGATKQQLDKAQADADSFNAMIAAKQAAQERYQLDLDYSRIAAELEGRISKPLLTAGNLVNAGGSDPLLTTIVSIDPIYVDFSVDERAVQRYIRKQAASRNETELPPSRELKVPFTFGLDTDNGFPHAGVLEFADNKYSEATGTIMVRGLAKNPDGRLIAGSRVRVRIPVSESYRAPLVPDTAVLSDQDRKYLLVLGKDNVVVRRDITPGRLLDDGMRVILPAAGEETGSQSTAWLTAWEQTWVITEGLQRARIDYPVQPLDATGQPIATVSAPPAAAAATTPASIPAPAPAAPVAAAPAAAAPAPAASAP